MQGHLHHLHQQLAALLSAALPQAATDADGGDSISSSSGAEGPGERSDDSTRVAALDSLHRTILYPPNSVLLPYSALFLSQGLSQLLSDRSYNVRRAAAVTYGSLCAVISSASLPSNGIQNHAIAGGVVDRFIGLTLPLLRNIGFGDRSAESAIEGLREFLNIGDAGSIEQFVPPILKACQELLEDERTSPSLLRQLLALLTFISLKFVHCFQAHFVDIVDLLLGWAFMPDLADPDRPIIMDSFLQFQKHWLSNLQFSFGLLFKFLGDMEVLMQDGSVETAPHFGRLLALLSCFSTVLQATASGMLELDLLQQMSDPVESMAPRLLSCISIFSTNLGCSKWMGEPWRCLILLAEILHEKFANFYSIAIGILFQCVRGVPSFQLHGVLKNNLQLLSLQRLGLLPSSVRTLLQFRSPLSQLRLHPNHLVVVSTAATYLSFLQHGCDAVVSQAMISLAEELEQLRGMIGGIHQHSVSLGGLPVDTGTDCQIKPDFDKGFSETELLSLIKFDLKMLVCSVSVGAAGSSTVQNITDTSRYERSARLASFILEKLDPFDFPVLGCLEFQVHVVRTLRKLSEFEFLSKISGSGTHVDSDGENQGRPKAQNAHSALTIEYLRKYTVCMVKALNVSSPVTVKLEALDWIHIFGSMVASSYKDVNSIRSSCEPCVDASVSSDLLLSVLDAAYDREFKVRSRVASVLEVLLQARLIYHGNFYSLSVFVLDKLGDPDMSIKNSFVRLLSTMLPITVFVCGFVQDEGGFGNYGPKSIGNKYYSNWKQVLALKQLPQKLHSQHLVSLLSYVSQRWKVPLSSWIQRVVFSCHGKTDVCSTQEVIGEVGANTTWKDAKEEGAMLNKLCIVNNLAAVWWLINEAARYCITLRLRTNLGGPTQTFAALERMLLDIPNVLLLDTEQSEGKYLGSLNFHLLPMRLLLDFVEALKKNVYNSYEGSSVLPCPTRQSSLFFRANRKVCEEWFSRICDPMMNAGLALHCDDATLHYCSIRLQELRSLVASAFKDKTRGGAVVAENLDNHRSRLTGDFLKVLRHASLALCRSHEPEALVGLQKWVAVAFASLFMDDDQFSPDETRSSRHFSWITGLVYQAQGQYEKAAAHFSHLLQSEKALSSMGSDGIQFIIERVIENYTSLSDWNSLEIWLTELQALRALHAGKDYSGALTAAGNEINTVHALACFDEGDIQAAWGYLDLTPKSSNELTLDPKVALERSEQMLLQLMLQRDERPDNVRQELERAKLMLDEALSVVPLDGLTEAAACATQLHCIFAFEEGIGFNGQEEAKQVTSVLGSLHQVVHSPISSVRQDCGLWIKVHRVYRTLLPNSFVTQLLCQKLLSLARKQRNFMLANRMNQYIRDHPSTCSEGKHTELLTVNLQYENILLKYAEGKEEEALIDLWSFVCPSILSTAAFASDIDALKAKACLKLSTWLRREHSNINLRKVLIKVCEDFHVHSTYNGSSFARAGPSFSEGNLVSDANWNIILEEIVGTARKISCHLCPTMGKTWLSYASWCFKQARDSIPLPGGVLQSCSLSPVLHREVSPERFQLTEEEMSKVEAIITKICLSSRDIQKACDGEKHLGSTLHPINRALVNSLAHQVVYLIEAAAGAPGSESSAGECPSSALSSELHVLFCTSAGTEESDLLSSVNELIDVYWSLRQRRVSLFGHAAHGYFQYLSYSSAKLQENDCASSYLDSVKEKARSCTLRAMLYVLHILLDYGFELRETLERGFATVPLLPWQEITAQLFARLSSHPKQEVRKQLEGLLMMLAKLSPSSIVYPMLVDIDAYEGPPSEELQRIFDCVVKLYPKLIHDVQLVINELGAMTVLWEELWLTTLQDLHTDVVRRIHMLKEEAARIAENATLSYSEKNKINAAKYSAMMAPVIVALERRLASTAREPQTAHEIWFHKEYGVQLKSAILAFKTPPESATALGDVWQPFDAIATSLVTYQRKSFISLREVAPQLALLLSSEVPMPGLEKQISMLDSPQGSTSDVQGIVTISSICEQVLILSTKTKPKKLLLLGSDGQKYTYLLKGREDLRLDARIMQLLQTVNSFLCSCTDAHRRSLAIRYYSVTPISARAGLIQWVDNVTSIYSVYKSWQNRTQLAQLSAIGAGNMNNQVPPVPRPSDMFYGKIIPALKEKGIRRAISRKDWPHEVKRKVLLDLIKETPRQLLWQEMWCATEGFRAFRSKAKRFSGTVAAMSMVGHILGLGDRHLDNILMDFAHGDVLHIDYNVCFDKGRRLKIPEIVPFRLTQTIEAALGLTGTEGTFRANCEAVISVLRKNKDIVLMLLEVFVWDPLVEWTRGHDEAAIGGEEKKGMELAVSLSLFASRVQEIRVPLQEHHDLLISTLPAAKSSLRQFLDVLNQYEVISTLFYHADKERSGLLQHETSAKSLVAEATSVSEKSRVSFEFHAHEFGQAKAVAAEKAQEAAMWVDQQARILDALRSGSIPDSQAHIRLSTMEDSLSLTSAVLMSGVPLTIVPEPTQAQCYDLDREVFHVITELENGTSCAIEALGEYAFVLQRVVPLNYITTSPVKGWAQILQLSVNNLSSDFLSLARRQAADLIAKVQRDDFDLVQHRHQDLFQKVERYSMEIGKVEDERSELNNSTGSYNEEKSKECLLSAFTKYMQSTGYVKNEDATSISHSGQNNHDGTRDFKVQVALEEKKAVVLSVLLVAVNELYNEVKGKVIEFSNDSTGRIDWKLSDDRLKPHSGIALCKFEEQVEKCVLVAEFVNEVQELVRDLPSSSTTADNVKLISEGNWASVFQATLISSKHLIEQMLEDALPEIISSVISYNSEVMEAFGSLSQIRGAIDSALEKLAEVELERANLVELERNYFMKVGLITEQQLALEEAAVKGRDHLSWEEAEELASQEEACRAQLDQLHQTWNQKDMRSSSLMKVEANIENSLIASERYFSSLISIEEEGDLNIRSSKSLLITLVKPFFELESIDQIISSYDTLPSYLNGSSSNISDLITSGSSLSESTWRFASLLKNHSFFIWKVGIMDSVLDSCIHDISSSVDHNFGLNQLYNDLRMKLEVHMHIHVGQYLKERVAPALMVQLEKENEKFQQIIEAGKEFIPDQVKRDLGAVRRVQLMLEEYCDAHENARAARSAISLMKRQVSELTEALRKTILEIVQLEWLHDLSSSYLLKTKVLTQNVLGDDKFSPLVLNLSRPKLLEKLQSSMSSIARSMECLQASERTSVSAEGQLERAMGWACAGPNTVGTGNSSVKSSGIPSEFHDHLLRRRQLLWAAREQSSDIIKICTSVMEFEASRDGLFRIIGEKSCGHAAADSRTWQQAYLNVLTRLDVTYHSFTRAEQEWKRSQNNLEVATNGLFSATNKLCVASAKAKSASGDLQATLLAMQDCAHQASVALSAFSRVSKGHTALTSECGSMLEEVLAITEGLHSVYNLGKEAAAAHSALLADLSKANIILLPLEVSLSTDVLAMDDAIVKESESNIDIPPVHGQALYQSYFFRLRETYQSLDPLVLSLVHSVKELHSLLTKLARVSSLQAGNLHKALEGLGESQFIRSQDFSLSRSNLSDGAALFEKEKSFLGSNGDGIKDLPPASEFSFKCEGWISPPEHSYTSTEHSYTSSPGSSITSIEASHSEDFDRVGQLLHCTNSGEDSGTCLPFTYTDHLENSCVEKSEFEITKDGVNAISSATGVPSAPIAGLEALSLSNEAAATDVQSYSMENGTSDEANTVSAKTEKSSLKQIRGHCGSHDDLLSCLDPASRVIRGKNAYALSVLRQVELKLEGRDIEAAARSMKISEQVEHLLKQATSVDNLCHMYEGWTPWI